jgi:hypothetical protein
LNAPNDAFMAAEQVEDLLALNAAWLRRHPNLCQLPTEEDMRQEARRRGQALPDRVGRAAEARANEPRYLKLIRALCARAGQELERVTAGDPTRMHAGAATLAWHFITDQGHHQMLEADGHAIMFRGAFDHGARVRDGRAGVMKGAPTGGQRSLLAIRPDPTYHYTSVPPAPLPPPVLPFGVPP